MLHEKLKNLPNEPGVYLMKDRQRRVLYVGKAKNLKNRVSSYFRAQTDHAKTRALVAHIDDFDVIIVASEVEALFLERTLIKHEKPPYNVLLRDDKEYPLLRVDLTSRWPRLQKVRRRKDDGATYLGPYGHGSQLNLILAAVYKIFPLIRCSEYEFEHAKRPCNYYHMKQCLGPCTLPVDPAVYHSMLTDVVRFLQGKTQEVVAGLREKMQAAALALDYEKAALYRDQIEAIAKMKQEQVVVGQELKEADVIGVATEDDHLCVQVLHVRDYTLLAHDSFTLPMPVQTEERALVEFLLQYYDSRPPAALVFLPLPVAELGDLREVLGRGQAKFLLPKKANEKKLVALANRNARYTMGEFLREKSKGELTLQAVKQALGLERLPRVIECLDISHIQGTATVASIVCFVDGKPAKNRYRKYNIDDEAAKPDDYHSIYLIMQRRLARAERDDDLPDLMVIDGGRGQLSSAQKALAEFPHLSVALVGLAKSRLDKLITNASGEPFHSSERVFLPDVERPVELELGSMSFRLLTHLRDEAHRFAITHHRKRRAKVRQSSLLEEVKGIGPELRKKLYAQFHDLNGLKNASLDDIKQVKGLSASVAQELYEKLHTTEDGAS